MHFAISPDRGDGKMGFGSGARGGLRPGGEGVPCLPCALPCALAAALDAATVEGASTFKGCSRPAAWLTWLRYEQARLLAALHRLPQFRAVLGFNFKVRPVRPLKIAPRQTRHFSPQAASEIASCAEDTSDPRLKRALERLAAHGKHQTS